MKISSAQVVICIYLIILLNNVSIYRNSAEPDQTAPRGAVWSGSTLFVKKRLNISADDKTDGI